MLELLDLENEVPSFLSVRITKPNQKNSLDVQPCRLFKNYIIPNKAEFFDIGNTRSYRLGSSIEQEILFKVNTIKTCSRQTYKF